MNTLRPLSLEDSCLARLVIDLQHYPLELLALLPLLLRYRLLANLPVLDLCQLERTSVAAGVDIDSIWRLRSSSPYRGIERGERKIHQRWPWNYIDPSSWSWREWYLHAVAETVLSNRPDYAYDIAGLKQAREYYPRYDLHREHVQYYNLVIDWLTSIFCSQFLNESGEEETRYDWQMLASPFVIYSRKSYYRLTPPRYAHYKNTMWLSDEELLTLLMRSCHFKPKCLFALAYHPPDDFDMSCLCKPGSLLLQSEACGTLKEFLSEVEELLFYVHCDWSNVPAFLLQSIFLDVHPKLKTLRLVFQQQKPYSRMDLKTVSQILAAVTVHQKFLQTIGLCIKHSKPVLVSSEFLDSMPGFIARPQFCALDIQNIHAPVKAIVNIFGAFLSSPYSHQQTLRLANLTTLSSQPHPVTPWPQPIPDSGLECKDLYLHDPHYDDDNGDAVILNPRTRRYGRTHLADHHGSYQIYKAFFGFHKIRLKTFGVGYISTRTQNCINTVHMAAQHPDIHACEIFVHPCRMSYHSL